MHFNDEIYSIMNLNIKKKIILKEKLYRLKTKNS
jgi:hypothetical protein